MPAPVINAEWLNLNALRNYPLSEEALTDIMLTPPPPEPSQRGIAS